MSSRAPCKSSASGDGARSRSKVSLDVIVFRSKVLPTKSVQQCYLQTQRLMGQQSLAEFMGLSVDIDRIAEDNGKKKVGTLSLTM